MNRRDAYRRIRRVIGPEVCSSTLPVAERWRRSDPEGADAVIQANMLTDRLRATLAALLAFHTSPTKRCPYCSRPVTGHRESCLLWLLLR